MVSLEEYGFYIYKKVFSVGLGYFGVRVVELKGI